MVAAWLDQKILQAETDHQLNRLTDTSLRAAKEISILNLKKGVDLCEGLAFFLQFGVEIWGGRLIHAVDLYAIIYGNGGTNLYIIFIGNIQVTLFSAWRLYIVVQRMKLMRRNLAERHYLVTVVIIWYYLYTLRIYCC